MWQKIGRIYDGHASYPAPEQRGEDIRVYFGTRIENRTHVSFLDYSTDHGGVYVGGIVLTPGEPGTFDCDGVAPRCVVGDFMYLIGWNRCQTVPYSLSIGLAVRDGETWQKVGPVLSRNRHDPYFCTSPCVLRDGDKYKMWYCSCTGWVGSDPRYLIKYAESDNGIDWLPSDRVCIDHSVNEAIGWPMVWKNNSGSFSMIYSHRGKLPYRLGEAVSDDGLNWTILDEPLVTSDSGWDSEMICYSSVIGKLMFYNGNQFGKTGMGLACQV